MNKYELAKILEDHKLWLETCGENGKRADLRGTNLNGTNLRGANLNGVDLTGADLTGADLTGADLTYSDLRQADLFGAYLTRANLKGADLSEANLDYSSFPLWCGSLDVHIDDKQAIQLLYHLVRNVKYSKNTSEEIKKLLSHPDIVNKANEFHRVDECGKI